ncbi:NEDD8 ultimate buster 1 [Dissostichus eleginoides]|uniref:NEDD8 ultimate buster 1 n=1 Tax=Dissostichus eleginoides TaxID=100907 RepID=A0AAD9BJ02_DISEL|nr:NEDD8 ultimate buster 1 [Dissostichus eleginoides]
MADQNLESKLKQRLKQEKIQLWIPPYTEEHNRPGTRHMQDLAERFAPLLCVEALQVESALEGIRVQAVIRWRGNQTFRETSVASVELLLPRGCKKDPKTKNYLETRLDVLAQEVVDRIGEEYGLKHIKLILNGKTLSADQRLDVQNVRNHSKVMVLKVSDTEWKQQQSEEEEKTKNGSEDTSPFLEIADQRGNPLNIPHQEKKALILAMGFHEKGRSLMKKKQFDNALCHCCRPTSSSGHNDSRTPSIRSLCILHLLLHKCGSALLSSVDNFLCVSSVFPHKCGSALLSSVDNFAVLQLDIVWSYRALEALSCLEDGKLRLLRAEDAFLKVYGEQQQRLRMIKRGGALPPAVPPPESPLVPGRKRHSGSTTTLQSGGSVRPSLSGLGENVSARLVGFL